MSTNKEFEELNTEWKQSLNENQKEMDKQAVEQTSSEEAKPFLETKEESTSKWYDSVHKDLIDVAKTFPTPEALVKSYKELTDYMSQTRKGISPPKDDAPQEEWDTFYKTLGRPDNIEDYAFKTPEGEDITPYNKNSMMELRKHFKKAGLNKKQALEVVKFLESNNRMQAVDQQSEYKKRLLEGYDALKREWGPDQFENNRSFAQKVYDKILPDPADQKALSAIGFDRQPEALKLLVRIGRTILDDDVVRDLRNEKGGIGFSNDPNIVNAQVRKWTREINRTDLDPKAKAFADKEWKKWKLQQNPRAFD